MMLLIFAVYGKQEQVKADVPTINKTFYLAITETDSINLRTDYYINTYQATWTVSNTDVIAFEQDSASSYCFDLTALTAGTSTVTITTNSKILNLTYVVVPEGQLIFRDVTGKNIEAPTVEINKSQSYNFDKYRSCCDRQIYQFSC